MPRPAEAWIEIRPLESGRPSDAPYLFYDSNFEPDMPCPVLEWLATDWPAAARQAEIRASFKMTRSPETRVSVGSLANRAPDQGSGATLEGLPGFTYQIRARRGEQGGELYRVDVVERYAADSVGVGAVKVELLPRPRRVVHRFDAPNRIAVHTFYVAADDRTIGTYEVVFTRRRDMQADAILLREPAVIDISDASDVIRLAPPTGGPELRPVERSAIR